MDYKEKIDIDTITIYASGKLVFSDHYLIRSIVENAINYKNIIIDMTNLDFIDSAGLGMLIIINETLNGSGGSLSILNPKGQVVRVFKTAKMYEILNIGD